ncbi:MAG: hypothetical protein ABFR90_10785 [Planctomycetota bacterium]
MKNDKLNKILVVAFLTLLVWAWAFMSQERGESFVGTLEVSPSADPSLLVTLVLPGGSPQTKIPLNTLNFKGAPSRISELEKRCELHKNREQLDFYYDPQEHDGTEGDYPLNILKYLQDSSKAQDLALTLDSCSPSQATVTIQKLVEKELPIECRDENNSLIPGVDISPSAFAKIYVREGDNDPAIVKLTQQQIETARKEPVEATPYVELGAAMVRREAENPVQITMKSEGRLEETTFQPKSIGFVMSPEIAGNYEIELLNKTELIGSTKFNTTDEAMDAYKKMRYHILIEIRDGDVSQPEISLRPVIYNFPPTHFKNGDIDFVEVVPAKTANFKLVPINPEAN